MSVCHERRMRGAECRWVPFGMRCCANDEGRPFGVALRGEASNRHMLRWLKTVVVSDVERRRKRRQVGIGKASASESLMTCRKRI